MKYIIIITIFFTINSFARDIEGAASSFINQARSVSGMLIAAPFFLAAACFSTGAREWGRNLAISGGLGLACYYGYNLAEGLIRGIVGQ